MSNDITIGIIGGSGLGEALADALGSGLEGEHRPDTPFGPPSAAIRVGNFDGVRIALLQRHGDGHALNPAAVPYRANIYALKMLGVTHIIASGATGSLRESIAPGDVVVCDQLIDKTNGRPKTFYDDVAVHVEFAEPFCPVMRQWLLRASGHVDNVTIHDGGTYVCMEGPSFSTKAESHMHRQWGADLVGMTALPEARLAREAEIAYALLGLPTDYDCWREREPSSAGMSLLEEIIGNLRRSTEASIDVIRTALRDVSMLREERSPAHDALALGIWTNRAHITDDARERYAPLWGRHIEPASA
ncbi:MAG: S-methyl-5'-thioadenosine phosphorylase [Planctomycetota bacterium]